MFTRRMWLVPASVGLSGLMVWLGCTAGAGVPNTSGGIVVGGGGGGLGGSGGSGGGGGGGGTSCNCQTLQGTWNVTLNGVPDGSGGAGGTGGTGGVATSSSVVEFTMNDQCKVTEASVVTGSLPPINFDPANPASDQVSVQFSPGAGTMVMAITYGSLSTANGSVVQLLAGPVDCTAFTWSGIGQYQIAGVGATGDYFGQLGTGTLP